MPNDAANHGLILNKSSYQVFQISNGILSCCDALHESRCLLGAQSSFITQCLVALHAISIIYLIGLFL